MMRQFLRLFIDNFWYKVMSVGLAVVIWGIIQGEQVQEVSREILVNIQVPPGFAIRGEEVRSKAATIRGPRVWMLEAPNRLEADIVIPPGKSGKYIAYLDKDKLRDWNNRLQINILDPSIEIYVDRLMERSVPIKEVLQGTPADGFIVEQVRLQPRLVNIKGPRSDLLKIRQVVTEPIDIRGIKESTSVDAKLINPGVKADAMSLDMVKVNLRVGDSKINKRYRNIPIEIVGSDYMAQVKPTYVSIMVQRTPGVLNFVDREDFKAFVEAQGLGPGRYEQDVKVKIPSDTVLIETSPTRAHVTILKERKINGDAE